MLLKEVPLSSKPVFDFRRLFSLLSMATAVAGSGNTAKGIVGLSATLGLSSLPPLSVCLVSTPPFFFQHRKGHRGPVCYSRSAPAPPFFCLFFVFLFLFFVFIERLMPHLANSRTHEALDTLVQAMASS